MIKTFGDITDFTAFKMIGDNIYCIAWGMQVQKITDENGEITGDSTLCDYMLEMYNYKPSIDLIIDDILTSGEQASMDELEAICSGLGVESLEPMKKAMAAYIDVYDVSTNVNSFLLNGAVVWLDKATRVGLMNSTTIAKNSGSETTTLWFNDIKLEVNCDSAIQMLSALELYALSCFNKTAEHKLNVSQLTSIEDLKQYDYTTGYPDKLSFTI